MTARVPSVWLTLVLAAACSPTTASSSEFETVPTARDHGLPLVDVLADVTSVVDGDSFRAVDGDQELEVRLLGINAPESEECFGAESAAWLTETLEGKEAGLALEPQPDQFGRLLAVVVVDQINVNEAALSSGHALVVSAEGFDRTAFVAAEDQARAGSFGMWADDICGASGQRASLEIVEVDYNPPGPDENETVTIVNNGSDTVDLDGFALRDESSVNRFVLPRVVLGEGESLTVRVTDCQEVESAFDWCSEQPVFNNDGDTAMLLDPFGRVVALARY